MVATDLGTQTKLDSDNIFQVDDELSLLKSAAVYGANASGKSNLVKAIGFMRWFVLNSSSGTQITDSIDVEHFRLSTETETKASFFEIVFILNKKIYRYGFEINAKQVISEWLFYTPKSEGRILCVDELDARLHPFITKSIVELFNSKDTNHKNAQLVFMTHDTNLLNNNLFRKDQIWFIEKDQYGATDLYSLVEYDIPDDAEYKNDYIKGKYGAIPYIGVLTGLFEDLQNNVS
jgi:AAA15 family ATPase/GTPase